MRNWNDLVGERINGLYMGLFPYTGRVVESRVKYGGAVQHTVVVDEPFMVYGDLRERILVENGTGEINRILGADEQFKTVKNLMTGKDVQIPVDTPRCCDPSSELFWSM